MVVKYTKIFDKHTAFLADAKVRHLLAATAGEELAIAGAGDPKAFDWEFSLDRYGVVKGFDGGTSGDVDVDWELGDGFAWSDVNSSSSHLRLLACLPRGLTWMRGILELVYGRTDDGKVVVGRTQWSGGADCFVLGRVKSCS